MMRRLMEATPEYQHAKFRDGGSWIASTEFRACLLYIGMLIRGSDRSIKYKRNPPIFSHARLIMM
jgi:hypothetical protein